MTEEKKEEKMKQEKESLQSLDKRLGEVDRSSSKKMKSLKDYEPFIAAALAFMFIASGMIAGNFLNESSSPAGFVVVDLTESACSEDWFCTEWTECGAEGIQARECLDFSACKTKQHKPDETMKCGHDYIEVSPLTSAAVADSDSGEGTDILGIWTVLVSWLSLLIVAGWIAGFYLREKQFSAHWLAFAYWLAMIGAPLAVYYVATRNRHIAGAYAALGVSFAALAVLLVLKPWASPEVEELKKLNDVLRGSSARTGKSFRRIRRAKIERENESDELMDGIFKRREERELLAEGIEPEGMAGINRNVRSLDRSRQTEKALEQVERAVKEREKRFSQMNQMLENWAEKRRRERAMFQKFRKLKAPDELNEELEAKNE